MSRTAWMITVLAGLVFGVLTVGFHARGEQARLRAAIAVEAKRVEEARAANAAAPAWEAPKLPDDRAAIATLRGEIEELKRRVEERARARVVEQKARRAVERSLLDEMVPAEAWRNRGRATPTATMETVLWAAAGGDVAGLAQMLTLKAAARAKAEALLSELPPSIRSQCATPEELVALLATNDVPLGSAMIIVPELKEELRTWRVVQISDGNGKIKRPAIALAEKDGAWSLVVPESAIDRYAARLKGGVTERANGK